MPRFKGAPNTISTDLYIPAGGDVMEALNSPRNAYLVGAAGPSIALFIAAIVFIICLPLRVLPLLLWALREQHAGEAQREDGRPHCDGAPRGGEPGADPVRHCGAARLPKGD